MAANESSRDSSTEGKSYIKGRTSDVPIPVLCVLLTGLILCWSCWRDLSSQSVTEIIDLKLGELTKELQQMKYNYEYQINILQERIGNGSYGHESKCQNLIKSLNNELDKLKDARGQQAKHLAGVSKHLTESAFQLQNLADVLCQQIEHGTTDTRGLIKKPLQQVVSSLHDVQTNLRNVTEYLILVGENMKQQEEEHRHTIAEIRRTHPCTSNPCHINVTLEGKMKILKEDFTNQLKTVNSKHQYDIEDIKHKLSRLEWLAVLVCGSCLVCFMYIVFIYTNGSGRPQMAYGIGPSRLPLQMVTVVTFTRETYEESQTALPEMLGQSAPTPREVNYKLLTGELDLTQIPSSCGYIVIIGYDARNSILEDMDGSMGSRKRLTVVGLQNRKCEVLVIYIEHDPDRREPPADLLYNTHLGRPMSHPILRQLVDNQLFLSLNNWKYTEHQADHIRKWVRSL